MIFKQITMKSLLIFAFLPLFGLSQGNTLKTGRWILNEYVIERPNDSTQVETLIDGTTQTYKVKWINNRVYKLNYLTVQIIRVSRIGYTGMVTDGNKKKYFEMIRL